MAYPTLEQLKDFEVGTKGLFLVRFEDTSFNLIKSSRSLVPATNVSYEYLKVKNTSLAIGDAEVQLASGIGYPETFTIEVLDDYREAFFSALVAWIKDTTFYKTGRVKRNYLDDCKKVTIYNYGKDDNGDLSLISVDSFKVSPPVDLNKSASSDLSTHKESYTFSIAGDIRLNTK
jgi:hypothetical protein